MRGANDAGAGGQGSPVGVEAIVWVWRTERLSVVPPGLRLSGWNPGKDGIFFSTMPTYEYVCEKCGAHLDIFQSMKDAALKTCPKDKCPKKVWGKGKIQRQLGTGAGFIFKGSGFYITDYRSAGYKKAAKEAGGGGEKSGGGEKKSSDSSGGGKTKSGEGKSSKSS